MPIHDWTRVEDGIFHHFHHSWIEELQRALNAGRLPDDYYAMTAMPHESPPSGNIGLLTAPPRVRLAGESEMEFYLRKQNTVTVRHVSGDRIVAMIEVVSPGNKSSRLEFPRKSGHRVNGY